MNHSNWRIGRSPTIGGAELAEWGSPADPTDHPPEVACLPATDEEQGWLLDRTLILNERHLRRTLTRYLEHHNGHRPHRALSQLCPSQAEAGPPRPINPAEHHAHRTAVLGGLINEYQIAS
jgi:hypothetical protein